MPKETYIDRAIQEFDKKLFDALTFDMYDDGSPIVRREYYEEKDELLNVLRQSLIGLAKEAAQEIEKRKMRPPLIGDFMYDTFEAKHYNLGIQDAKSILLRTAGIE